MNIWKCVGSKQFEKRKQPSQEAGSEFSHDPTTTDPRERNCPCSVKFTNELLCFSKHLMTLSINSQNLLPSPIPSYWPHFFLIRWNTTSGEILPPLAVTSWLWKVHANLEKLRTVPFPSWSVQALYVLPAHYRRRKFLLVNTLFLETNSP